MDLGKSRYRVNSIKMRKNVYRLLGILIMAMFSFAPLYAYELKVRVENESTHEPVIEYEVHAYMNNATHDFVCKAVFSPADSTFMFTGLPEDGGRRGGRRPIRRHSQWRAPSVGHPSDCLPIYVLPHWKR